MASSPYVICLGERLTVLFEEVGYKELLTDAVLGKGMLSQV